MSESGDKSNSFTSSPSAFRKYQPLTNLQRGNVVQTKVPDEVALAQRSFHTLAAQGEVFSLPCGHSNLLDQIDEDSGLTPLQLASYHGHLSTVKLMLAKQCSNSPSTIDADTVNELGQSALTLAAYNGHFAIVKELLDHPDHRIDIDRTDDHGNTPLMYAVYNGKTAAVNELLKHFPDINCINNYGESAYSLAVESKNSAMISLIDNHLLNLLSN